jgi:hypothetical protein
MQVRQTNTLWPEDRDLFSRMKGHYVSDNEKEFFETQENKQKHLMTVSNDLVMSERSNEDHLYIIRCWFDEYIVGNDTGEEHFMNLSDALNANLKELGILEKDETLFQWLRLRDYQGVEYDKNFDDL